MSGLEVTELIRRQVPAGYTIPPFIVAMTANALDNDRQKCIEVGMDDFISKPFTIEDLKRALTGAVRYQRRHL